MYEKVPENVLRRMLERIHNSLQSPEVFEDLPYNPDNQKEFKEVCIIFFREVQEVMKTLDEIDGINAQKERQ